MQKPKGTKDIFGDIQIVRNYIFKKLMKISEIFNFKKIETPIFERKEVFVKSVGETSDIVSKEMYVFEDKANRKMVLRPEGTAGTIRAIVENKLYAQALPLKLYYEGPMFRYENPQKGRQRQFTQFGVEVLGEKSPFLDAEIISFAAMILNSLNISYELKINSLGDKKTRDDWSNALKKYFNEHRGSLTKDSLKRIEINPMRILDDKIDAQKDFVLNAPKITDFYSNDTNDYFNNLKKALDQIGIKYIVDEKLVRGLDYYTDTAFEFVSKSKEVGSQSTIIGGGRYENLVSQFGGPNLSGIGFGLGIERLTNDLLEQINLKQLTTNCDVYVMNIDSAVTMEAFKIVDDLRKNNFIVEWNYQPTKIQKAFAKADSNNAKLKIIVGQNDIEENQVTIKIDDYQQKVSLTNIVEFITKKMGDKNENN